MRRTRSYFFSDSRNEYRPISHCTIKGTTGKRRERKKTMRETEGRDLGECGRWRKRARRQKKKSFIPCDDKGLSQSRLIACSSPFRPSSYPFAVATNFDSCFAYATFPTLLRHPFLPSLDLVHPRALDPFTTELSQFRHFVLTVAFQLSLSLPPLLLLC